jgi:hypothetical protein
MSGAGMGEAGSGDLYVGASGAGGLFSATSSVLTAGSGGAGGRAGSGAGGGGGGLLAIFSVGGGFCAAGLGVSTVFVAGGAAGGAAGSSSSSSPRSRLAARRCISASEVAPPLQLQPVEVPIIMAISSQQHQRINASSSPVNPLEYRWQSDQACAKLRLRFEEKCRKCRGPKGS